MLDDFSPFVTGLWAKGADEKLAAVDVYMDPNSGVLSNIPALQSSLDTVGNSLKSVKGMVANVQNALKIAQDLKSSLTAGSVLDRINNSTGLINSTLTKAGIDTSTIMKYVDQGKALAVKIETGINNAKDFKEGLQAMKFEDYVDVCDAIGKMVGIEGLHTVVDLGMEIATSTVVLKKYLGAGGDDALTYQAVMDTMSDVTNQPKVVSNLLPTVLTQSKLYTLRAMNQSLGSGVLLGIQPDVIRRFAATFVKPTFSSFEAGKSYYKDVIDTFYEIDPKWNQANWGQIGEDVNPVILDLSELMGASADFKSMVGTYALSTAHGITLTPSTHDKLAMLITLLQNNTVKNRMNTHFPAVTYKEAAVTRG